MTVKDIIENLNEELICVHGDVTNLFIDNIADVNNVTETSLDWINTNKQDKQTIAESSIAKVLITDKSVIFSESLQQKKKVLIQVKDPRKTMIKVAIMFLEKKEPGIHSSAIIDSEAIVDQSAHIGAGCVVGKATIGADTVLMPNVVVYDGVKIGNRCLIHAGVVIGTDGLGCTRDEEGKLTKFPHLGGVIIEDDVEIGANSQVAKGAFSDTFIKNGCKLNGLCFVAHNCVLEENVWITGDTMLCGSVHVGKNTTIFSNVVVRDKRIIGEGVVIGMGSVVTKDVPSGETWVGNPAKKFEK